MRVRVVSAIQTLLAVLLLVPLFASSVALVSPQKASALPANCQKSFLTIPAWYNYLPESPEGNCQPSLGDGDEESRVNTSLAIGVAVLEGILRLSTFVAVIMIFFGSFKFITTQGNSDSAAKARQTVINSAIGFAIVLIAAQLVAYVGRTLAT